ncbi:MAG: phosphoglycerate dehydrogenase [Ruaniaceae bacterium]|nr:phosphoglycerate dehydrogenase [Ruaniaceae bacterium]
MKILVPSDLELSLDLPSGVDAVEYDPDRPLSSADYDAEALVTWVNSVAWLDENIPHLTNLMWVQSCMAGPDRVLASPIGPDVLVCSGRGLHDQTVAEHATAMLLSTVRRMPLLMERQKAHMWNADGFNAPILRPQGQLLSLINSRVLIWGFGSIGSTLAPILTALGAEVTGVARSDGERGGYRVVSDIRAELPTTDVLVMILPASAETTNALDAEMLALLPPHAVVVNVGRGVTIDEEALVAALEAGELAGAALDVAWTEPLPAESPLWDAPGILITPHVAGYRPLGAADLIARNVRHLLAGEPLENQAR